MIKANAITVTVTNANNNKYIIANNTDSTIAPPPFSQYKNCVCKDGNTHLAFLTSYKNYYIIFNL